MRWCVAVLGMIACGPAVSSGDGGSTGGGDPSTSTSSSSSTASTSSTTVDPVTSTTASSSGEGEASTTTGRACPDVSEEPPEPCGPEPDGGGATIRIDHRKLSGDDLVVDAPCTVGEAVAGDDEVTYALACEEATGMTEHELTVFSDRTIDFGLEIGDAVHLRAARNFPIDSGGYHFVALRDADDGLVVATYQPYRGEIPEQVDVESFYAPLTFEAVDMGCEAVADGHPDCDCPPTRTRLAVEFTHGVDTALVWYDTTADLGPLRVHAFASSYEPTGAECILGNRPYTGVWWDALRPI